MKRILFVACFLLLAGGLQAQMAKVQTAIIYMKSGELEKAKEAIDEAAENPSSNTSAKTWFWRGQVYWDLFGRDTTRKIHPDPLPVAMESYKKCLELDKKENFREDPENAERMLKTAKNYMINEIYNRGVAKYNKKDYAGAFTDFELLVAELPTDTNILFNTGLFADRAGNKEKAKMYFTKCIEGGMKRASLFTSIASIQKSEKDTAGAIKTLEAGRVMFPNESALLIDELGIYLSAKNQAKAIEILDNAIKLDPKNHTLYFAAGKCYDDLKDTVNAAKFYLQCVSVKPDFFDAYYNLGAMYFNQAAEMVTAANKIPMNQQKKYDEAKAKFIDRFKKAQPFLEKGLELMPKDYNTLLSLQQLYANIGMLEKSAEMKKRKEALKN